MAARQTLNMRQTPSLVMTQQMQLAVKLLTLSNLELADYVERELENNPLLERDEREFAPVAAEGDAGLYRMTSHEADNPTEDLNQASEHHERGLDLCPVDQAGAIAGTYDEAWQGTEDAADVQVGAAVAFEGWGSAGMVDGGGGTDAWVGDILAEREGLRSTIERQINLDIADPEDKEIASFLADHLDAAGYLAVAVDHVADRLGHCVDRVEAVLGIAQGFEPTGVFARNLKECLRLQLIERRWLDDTTDAVLTNLHLLADANLEKLAKVCSVSTVDAIKAVKRIRSLNPKPAQGFETDVAATVTPDVILSNGADGGWIVRLNAHNLPRVLVNHTYQSQIAAGGGRRSDHQYLKHHYDSAHWLISALHQRAQTMMKVATAIVERQYGFFKNGVLQMQPLGLKDIAAAIDMHESTVSRATANKFIQTPQGTFELSYFFNVAVNSDADGSAMSSEAVRHRIKALVHAETPDNILSDDLLVEKLAAEGMSVARRTVAKYRESLNIPASAKRRRLTQMQATNPCTRGVFAPMCGT